MAVIDHIELYLVTAPLPAPFAPAWVPGSRRSSTGFYLIRLVTDDGVEGWSAFSASGAEKVGIGEMVAGVLLGVDPCDIPRVLERLRIMNTGGNVNWWIEPACWDIKAKMAGLPLYKMLGGTDDKLQLYASSGELRDIGARREEAEARLDEGFTTFKMRVHDWDEAVDIAQLQDLARHMGGRQKIAVDCNQAFRLTRYADAPDWSLDRAKRFADAAADVGAAWVEEPQFMERYDDMAALAAYSRVPIAGAELHIAGYPELRHMVDRGCYHIYQPDAMWAGGVDQCLKSARYCREKGVKFTAHTWSNGIGFIVNAHVMAASGFASEMPFEYPLSPPGWTAAARDALLGEGWGHDRGWFTMPTTPGLGFEIDRTALARFGKCFFRGNRRTSEWMPEAVVSTPKRETASA